METPNIKAFNYKIDDGFLWSEVNLKGERRYYVEGYASTIDQDKAGEIISAEAQGDIYNQILNQNITMDVEHEEWYDDNGKLLPKPKNEKIPVAKIVDAKLTPKGVWVKAEINRHLPSFGSIWNSIKDGFLKAFSIAFYPVRQVGGVINKLNLVNVTLTGSPVNPNATFTASMKSAQAYLDSLNTSHPLPPNLDNNCSNELTDPVSPKIKSLEENTMEEDKKEYKCKDCDKEYPSQEALDTHIEEVHSKKENEAKAEPIEDKKLEDDKKPEDDKEAETKGCGKIKSEEQTETPLEAEVKSLKEEVAKLKAELQKPVMKAIVEKEIPQPQAVEPRYISPLELASKMR